MLQQYLHSFYKIRTDGYVQRRLQVLRVEDVPIITVPSSSETECRGKSRKVKLLLDNGADPNTYPKFSKPAVIYHLAYRALDTAHVMLENGAHPELIDSGGFNTILIMSWKNQIEALKTLHKKHPQIKWAKTFLISSRSLTQGPFSKLISDINVPAGFGNTCAHLPATPSSNITILEDLHSKSCILNALNDLQETHLDVAMRCGASTQIINRLIKMGVKSGGKFRNGVTALRPRQHWPLLNSVTKGEGDDET
ncbi:hypothetical protein BJY04DRAFT_223515 [Aspergillus karnatakaensis]|uniref:uncharacterized protein n=1 Tax=Aspergillus karnatakaensis TaxID=1810916 RepID=UPI003CCCE1D9